MQIRSNIRAGQAAQDQSSNAQAVVTEMIDTLQKDIQNLRIWSLIRVKGPGVSSWTFLNQKPPSQQTNQG